MIKKGVLFDFDGVILNSMEYHYQAWNKAFQDKNLSLSREVFFLEEGQGLETISRKLGERYGLSDADIEEIQQKKVVYFRNINKIKIYPGFSGLIGHLKQLNIPVGVVTGGDRSRVKPALEHHFEGIFDCLVAAKDTKRGKPFPDPYLKGAELLKFPADACVVIENAPLGIKAAKTANMYVIAITTTLQEKHLQDADVIFDSFKQVGDHLNEILTV